MMHWAVYIIAAGIINAFVNFGYKMQAAKENIFLIAACVMAVTSVSLFSYVAATKGIRFSEVSVGNTPLVILAMGIGSALIMLLFVTGLSKGPISLADPLLACVYTLMSVVIGVVLLREAPSTTAYLGIALYLGGAILMARG